MGVVLNPGRLTLVAQPVREEEYKGGGLTDKSWAMPRVGNLWSEVALSTVMEKLLEFPVDKGFHSYFTKSDQNIHEI